MARRTVSSVALILATVSWTVSWTVSCGGSSPDTTRDVPVRVDRVAVDSHDLPVLVLEEEQGPRWLPIWIGTAEARSIALNGTYYAVLTLRARAGEVEIDSRPSDAIAIALRAGAPIFVRAELFESSDSKDAVETTTEGSPGRAI
jgi:bifunctional DNase/RNase